MNMPTPFATQTAAAPTTQEATSHPFASNADATGGAAATTAAVGTKAPRKKARRLTMTEQDYVLQNYSQKNPSTIAQELTLQSQGKTGKDGNALPEVTSAQVANTVRSARKKVEAKIAAAQEAGDTNAVNVLTARLEEALPKRSFPGAGGGKSGPRTSSLDSLVDSLFSV
jgi:hypothetical protein